MNDTMQSSPELQRFLALAKTRDVSDAAIAATELAMISVENAAFLDEDALRGFVIFLSIAKVSPDRAHALLEGE